MFDKWIGLAERLVRAVERIADALEAHAESQSPQKVKDGSQNE